MFCTLREGLRMSRFMNKLYGMGRIPGAPLPWTLMGFRSSVEINTYAVLQPSS